MLVRLAENYIRDLPDDVAVLLLADPSHDDDISCLTSYYVNVIVHGVLGAYAANGKRTFDDAVDEIRRDFSGVVIPEDRMVTARQLVQKYNIEVPDDEVGMVDIRDMLQFTDEKSVPHKQLK